MEFVNLTRAVEIGANSFLIRSQGKNIVLDSGMHPKQEGMAALPDFSQVTEGRVDAIIISHAHQDHTGSLPILTRREQQARVFMTSATLDITDIMLHNSANVMSRQRTEKGIEPIFTHRSVDLSQQMWRACREVVPYGFDGERVSASDEHFELHPAGHILGAAGIKLFIEGKTVLYTGDVNFEDQTLIRGARFPESGVEVLIMETTRGDSPSAPGFTRAKEEDRLAAAILAGLDRGGSVTIPVFALGKTQEVLAMLWRMRKRGVIPETALTIGGLSTKISEVYDALSQDGQRMLPDLKLLDELDPFVLGGDDIAGAQVSRRAIYALSSGMMSENTVSNIFARKIIPDDKQSLFFVGYSDPSSPAARLRAAKHGDLVVLDERLAPVPKLCHTDSFTFSAHSSRETLLDYALRLAPKKILLTHGDRVAIEWFRSQLAIKLPATEVIVPEPGQPIEL